MAGPYRRLIVWLLSGAMALLLIGPIGKHRAGQAGVAGHVHRTAPARRVSHAGTIVRVDRGAVGQHQAVAAICNLLMPFEAIVQRDDPEWLRRPIVLPRPRGANTRTRGPPRASTSALAA